MNEQPPVPGSKPKETSFEDMTVEQLEQKALELTTEINELLQRNTQATDRDAIKALQTMISKKTAERTQYILRRGELLQKGSKKPE